MSRRRVGGRRGRSCSMDLWYKQYKNRYGRLIDIAPDPLDYLLIMGDNFKSILVSWKSSG
jgi:hypothetical protein